MPDCSPLLLLAQAATGEPAAPRYPNPLFLLLIATLVVGSALKLLGAIKSGNAAARIAGERPTVEQIAGAVRGGRKAIVRLFALLSEGQTEAVRRAAGSALATLWAQDELIVEEEKALVTRGFSASWKARRRYPRALDRPIPLAVEFGVPFLEAGGPGIAPEDLEWSARVAGSDRASLETFGPWTPGGGRAEFSVDPRDYPTNGPHRRILHARVRTRGLTSTWEMDLPQVPFSFDFDPNLAPSALLGTEDEARGAQMASAMRLELDEGSDDAPAFFPLGEEFALRGWPVLRVEGALPADLACTVGLEIEGITEPIACGGMVASKDPELRRGRFRLEGPASLPPGLIETPGDRPIRAVLMPDLHRGWSDPDVRSVWPGTVRTGWVTARLVRR